MWTSPGLQTVFKDGITEHYCYFLLPPCPFTCYLLHFIAPSPLSGTSGWFPSQYSSCTRLTVKRGRSGSPSFTFVASGRGPPQSRRQELSPRVPFQYNSSCWPHNHYQTPLTYSSYFCKQVITVQAFWFQSWYVWMQFPQHAYTDTLPTPHAHAAMASNFSPVNVALERHSR